MVLPIPRIIREPLIAHYCVLHGRSIALNDASNRDCLIRVYLEVRRGNRNFRPEFSLRNFEADLNIPNDLHLEKAHHAQAMAHMSCGDALGL